MRVKAKRHQAWDAKGHNWQRQAYINDAGVIERPAYWWRCDDCGASGYGEISAGGHIEPYNLIDLPDGIWASQGFRPLLEGEE